MSEDRSAPEAVDVDPMLDPHLEWQKARAECPVGEVSLLGHPGMRVMRFDASLEVLRDNDGYSSRINQETMGPYMGPLLLGKDGAEHTRYRNLVSHAFRASALARWRRELIEPTVHSLLDAIAPRGRAELVADLTSRFPVQVIAGIVGVPMQDHERFNAWAQDIAMGPVAPERGLASSKAMREYLTPIVEERRRHPREDLISDLVDAEIEGQRLDDEHVYGFLRLLMPAGAETTYRAMGSCLVALLTHPEALARVRDDRSLLPRAIEETLRWDAPITLVNRLATRETRLEGTRCPAGASVLLVVGSANRDESRWQRSSEWDLDREERSHLAFGWGRHLCLGIHLARLELEVGLGAVLDRLPGLRLDPDEPAPEIAGLAFRGPARIPVLFRPS